MSQTLASSTFAGSIRRALLRSWADPESRSTLVGLAGVILFYLLLWLIAPYLLRFEPAPGTKLPAPTAKLFNIELAPDVFAKPVPKSKPDKFVEANPDAPENTPDKTNNFSDRNQQVAQEKPTPDGKNDRPALEGKKDFDSTQIVDGHLNQPVETVVAVPPPTDTREAQQTIAAPKLEQNPLPGFEKTQGDNPDSFGSNVVKLPANPKPIPDKIEGAKDVPQVDGATANQIAIDPQHPRPRPQVVKQQNTRPAIFAENKFGTSNMGITGIDARWSNYGAYLRKMIDTVQTQWERILIESKVYPSSGSSVTVKFVMDSEGKISRIVNVDSTASDAASRACISGITDRAPYGLWTDDMIAMLGKEQEMTFTFYYQ